MRKPKAGAEEAPLPSAPRKFDAGWDSAVEIGILEEALKTESDEGKRKIQREIRSLENKITPTAKRVAADRNRPLVKAMLRYIQKHGSPSNIAALIEWLRGEGFVIGQDNQPMPANGVTARTVRNILHDTFGVEGRMGRKPKVP